MTGKSGLGVKVRSTTRTAPDATAQANWMRPLLSIVLLPFFDKPAYAPSSRSTALGLAARRWRISSATSPTNTSSSPRFSADTIAVATARGATFGGGTVWNHSISSGPVKTFTTLTPPGRSSARRQCDNERQAACDAEYAPNIGQFASA